MYLLLRIQQFCSAILYTYYSSFYSSLFSLLSFQISSQITNMTLIRNLFCLSGYSMMALFHHQDLFIYLKKVRISGWWVANRFFSYLISRSLMTVFVKTVKLLLSHTPLRRNKRFFQSQLQKETHTSYARYCLFFFTILLLMESSPFSPCYLAEQRNVARLKNVVWFALFNTLTHTHPTHTTIPSPHLIVLSVISESTLWTIGILSLILLNELLRKKERGGGWIMVFI